MSEAVPPPLPAPLPALAGRPRLWPLVALTFAVAASYLAAELALAGRLGPSIDDGWIYLAFARSAAEGQPFTYPGHDGPVAAISGPLWCVVLAGIFAIAGSTAVVAKVSGIVVAIFAVFGSWRLARAATGDERLAFLAGLLVAATARVMWGALSGMEIAFATGLSAFGLAFHLERRHASFGRWLLAAAVLAAAGWARPECFAFLLLAALHRRRLDGLLVTLPVLASFPLVHLAIFGDPLPTPFHAKAGAGTPFAILAHDGLAAAAVAAARGIALQVESLISWLPTFMPLLAPTFLLGLRRGLRERNGLAFVATAILWFALARGALGFQPPPFQQGRYFLQLWPLFAIVGLGGCDLRRISTAWSVAVLLVVAAGAALLPAIAALFYFDWFRHGFQAGSTEIAYGMMHGPAIVFTGFALAGLAVGIRRGGTLGRPPTWAIALWLLTSLSFGALRHAQGVRDTYELNVAMAEIVAREVPPGEEVACHDIGALGFFADRPLLDLAGLGTPEIARLPRAPGALLDATPVLLAHRPRFVCLTDAMARSVNPDGRLLPGVRAIRPIATIRSERNVTVNGHAYHLIELEWE